MSVLSYAPYRCLHVLALLILMGAAVHIAPASGLATSASVDNQCSAEAYRVGGPVKRPRLIEDDDFILPPTVDPRIVSAVERVDLVINGDGIPQCVEVKNEELAVKLSSGITILTLGNEVDTLDTTSRKHLADTAQDAAKSLRFEPATLHGLPVSVRMSILLSFERPKLNE